MIRNFRLTAALGYAARGWRVFPVHWPRIGPTGKATCSCGRRDCGNVGKHPLTAHGCNDATTDVATIEGWWAKWPGANIGIATGAATGFIVLDMDPKNGGRESFARLCDEFGDFPETLEADTGGGGIHFMFAHPGIKVPLSVGDKGWLGEPGLDIRGDGGYIVAPPSQHASGRRYAWRTDYQTSGFAVMPDWMLARLPKPDKPKARTTSTSSDTATHWLGKALARATEGNRNDTGLWLACQLRDAGLSEGEAERVLCDYAARCPGESRYTDREAMATVRSAYSKPPREPAKGDKPVVPIAKPKVGLSAGAADELKTHLLAFARGQMVAAPMPWEVLNRLTNWGIPGTVTAVCGEPGVGKTFFVLQCLQFWHGNGFDASVFFVEKDRKFHTTRLLAQLEDNGNFTDPLWLPGHEVEVEAAMRRHAQLIDELGKCIWSSPEDMVTLGSLLQWVTEQAEAGKQIIVIDPISAASAGKERWAEDDRFMIQAQKVMTKHNSRLLLISHPKKGANSRGTSSGHDLAGGAAYHRFTDTVVWIHKPKKAKPFRVKRPGELPHTMTVPLVVQLHKTRNGRGAHQQLAFTFGDGLMFAEQGLIVGEVQEQEEGAI
ncbi:MAG: bifunctional DNA primase/polymerase [Tenuifilaceae bacterium]